MKENKQKLFEESFKLFEKYCDIVDKVLEERRAGAYNEQMKIVRKELR
jgi:hypothetical protein